MRRWILLLGCMYVISCAHNADVKSAESIAVEAPLFEASDYSELDLLQDKLETYYELSVLEVQHPEFAEDLQSQIQSMANTQAKVSTTAREIQIQNLVPIGSSEIRNDSTTVLRLAYDIVSERRTVRDSITAVIITKAVQIDHATYTARKISFEH